MKIRRGFVSNSSTASFTLQFKNKPETWEELHAWLYPKGKCEHKSNWSNHSLTSEEVAKRVFEDLRYTSCPNPLQQMAAVGGAYVPPVRAEVSYEDNDFFFEALMDSDFELFTTSYERE